MGGAGAAGKSEAGTASNVNRQISTQTKSKRFGTMGEEL
jgi:hypothetical protein